MSRSGQNCFEKFIATLPHSVGKSRECRMGGGAAGGATIGVLRPCWGTERRRWEGVKKDWERTGKWCGICDALHELLST